MAISGEYGDKIIGGWTWDESMDLNGNNEPDANEMVQTDNLNPGDDGWGYITSGVKKRSVIAMIAVFQMSLIN